MRIRTWHRHPRADVALTTWGSVTVTVSDGVRSYSSQHGTLNPFAHAVLTGFPAKNGVCTIRLRDQKHHSQQYRAGGRQKDRRMGIRRHKRRDAEILIAVLQPRRRHDIDAASFGHLHAG